MAEFTQSSQPIALPVWIVSLIFPRSLVLFLESALPSPRAAAELERLSSETLETVVKTVVN